ncbi:TMEM175 family protein [Kutzneria kofuensis]|uniref:Putative membrane protein n=1 Tax=Kutzneria kofuensis TaxID=103725 RepID=A0A7W9KFM6_9PSEU|nr:TMEM175 family protein [Kutzneria kofuensis]MBB5891258.1 putative membrane protein [Kutzneria kofuensis]
MTEKSPERLVFFTDAVVAIALTLLVLPLTEIVPEVVAAHGEPIEAITRNQAQIWSFLLSFAVIARQWISHHRLFEQVRAYSTVLFLTNMVWLLTVVLMPFATQMVGGFSTDQFTCLLYIGTIVVNSACVSVLTVLVRSDRELRKEGSVITDRWLFNTIGTTVALAAAFLLELIVPSVNYYGLLLLVVPPIVARLVYPDAPKPTKLSE